MDVPHLVVSGKVLSVHDAYRKALELFGPVTSTYNHYRGIHPLKHKNRLWSNP